MTSNRAGTGLERVSFGRTYWRSIADVGGHLAEISPAAIDDANFRLLADHIPTLCWMANGDGYIVWYNRRWHDYCGTTPAEMQGWGWQSVHDPDLLPAVMDRWTSSIATGEPFEMTFPLRGADGLFRPFLTRIQPVRDATGHVARWFGVNTEISELQAAEQALLELNETLEMQVEKRTRERDRTWNNAQDLLAVADKQGIFQAANPAWNIVLGWDPNELVGRHYLDFVHPDDHASSENALSRAAITGPPRHENRYRHRDGSYRWIAWVASSEDNLIYASGRHITAEKEAAEALTQAEEQLRQSQKMEAVGQLTGGLAHDFNNLLAGISGSLELLQARIMQGRLNDVERYVAVAQGASKRAAALTHRLLAFTRRQTLNPKPSEINRLVGGMEDLIRRTVGPQITVEVVGAMGLWLVLVDQNQLENALLNLCINARDAMPDGGRLTIETGNRWLDEREARNRGLPPGQYVSLCVSDSGTGMTPEVMRRAFDPFFTTKPIGMGTGLGLSMIYGFVQQSGGQVRLYSEFGQGAMVCLYLPRHLGELQDADEPVAQVETHRAEQGQTVLVVDDEPTVRMLVTEVLENLGYIAIEAADGAAGLEVLRSNARIDLLISDVGLPGGMNGRQVADAGRAVRPGLNVLFITGYAENAVLSHGHLEPGMHILTKPFAIEALTSRIKELVSVGDKQRRRNSPSPKTLNQLPPTPFVPGWTTNSHP